MNILVKYPTRARPEIFLRRLAEYVAAAPDMEKIRVLVSYDLDDATMTQGVRDRALAIHPHVTLVGGNNQSKIEACNADIASVAWPWEVLLLISDDMQLRRTHWADLIRAAMARCFPDTDGCLWFHDGSKQKVINTLPCIGRKWYDRFGYVYHPSYASFFCDNEATEVAQRAERIQFIETVLASHEHPAWGGSMKQDELYRRNNKYWRQDEANYHARKAAGFPA